ncbi:hypothetical protein JX266_010022 [Neoarthrinium moseri]|nr:hypothetical protein JX266_010022 [Neoarthrinium moseri]
MSTSKSFPPSSGSVEVTLLDGGGFTTAEDARLHQDGDRPPFYLYDWLFLIHHQSTGKKVLWDLGISNDRDLYTPFVLEYQWGSCNPVGPRVELGEQLKSVYVHPNEIDSIIFSHAHWDHCRPSKGEFPHAKVKFGPGTGAYCQPGHVQNGKIVPNVQWDARIFGDDYIKQIEYEELQGPWVPWGPFERGMDYFGDGSFWILDAPGHMVGNLAAAARLTNGHYVILASDCCHSKEILNGSKEMAIWKLPDGGTFCLHEDPSVAKDTIRRLREASDDYGAHIAMSHDASWIQEGNDKVLMSILHPLFGSEGVISRIKAGEQP